MYYNNYNNYPQEGERFFLVPFLLGGLGGAAIASAARPRPVYVNPPAPVPVQSYNPYPYGYNYYGGYNYTPSSGQMGPSYR